MEETKNRHGRRRSIIRDSCLNTSAYGLSRVARSSSMLGRFFWLISFLGFTAVMIYFIVRAILAYFQYPTKIDVTYVNKWPPYFPAFSFCNLSPLRSDRIIDPLLNYSNAFNWTNRNGTPTISEFNASSILDFSIDQLNRNKSVESFMFSLSSMLHSCVYNNQPCSTSDFILFTSASFGLCYTFNAKMKNSSTDNIRLIRQNGGEGTLSLGIYVHSHQYVPQLTDSIGLIALIHDNTQLPLIESAGIELAPGQKHRLSYKEKKIMLLPAPYSDCADNMSIAMKTTMANYNGADYGYSDIVCYELCQQNYIFEKCGCVNPNEWNARSVVITGTNNVIYAPLCKTNNICYIEAIDTFTTSSSLTDKYCANCKTQCSLTDYSIQISSSATPMESQMNNIKMFVESSTVPLPSNWSNTWREQISESYLRVDVVCQTTIVETNIQTATLGPVDLLSNIGGQTGLWIGVSFLSLMELIEILYRLIQYHFHSNQVDSTENQEKNATSTESM
ncbi:hypothetical protein I4U23_023022 [Adineta vaga]|nr:hypothetical protein I4U23_023022 [Adineta vaga]